MDCLASTNTPTVPQLRSLGEHEREELLMQLAEPLQFLHSLDFVHVFEYYYR